MSINTIFFDFQVGGRPPSWIFNSLKFQLLARFGGPIASASQILRRLVKPLPRYGHFNCPYTSEGQNASSCQISCRSVKQFGYDMTVIRFFKMAAIPHLGFVICLFGPPAKSIWWSLSLCKIWFESVQYFR